MNGSAAEDRRRLADMVERHGPPVRAFFARRTRNNADVEDMTQDVFIRILGRADLDTIENPEAYIFQVAANVLRDRIRQSRSRIALVPEDSANNSHQIVEERSPERILLGREACTRVVRALQTLPERTRTVFVLNRYELMSAREIARHMGISVSLVEKEMMRALGALRDAVR